MSNKTKRFITALGLLLLWFLFVWVAADVVVSIIVLGVAGWQVGNWTYQLAQKWFPVEDD